MVIIWDGITKPETLMPEGADLRQRLADAAKSYDWVGTLELLARHPQWVNASRPGGSSLYAPLHQAAHGGAPIEVVEELLALGAWRALRNAKGERSIDVARREGHQHLVPILEPAFKREVPPGILLKLQQHFHTVIRGRAARLVEEHALRLPELEPLLEMVEQRIWFAVPGMYGGFGYRLERAGEEPLLVAESWSRVVGGSGQRHEITPSGSRLVAEGFV
jgi:hypothetical protein